MLTKEQLTAREEIRDCLYRYARGVDRHDPELMLSAYHDDAIDDHGDFIGPAANFAKVVWGFHARWDAHQHHITNVLIEFDTQGIASVETYFMMTARERGSGTLYVSGGRYLDRFEQREGRWAIAERLCLIEWRLNPASSAEALAEVWIEGFQDRRDPSYRRPISGCRPFRDPASAANSTAGVTTTPVYRPSLK